MQHAKFQNNSTSGSGEDLFLNVLNIYGHAGHLN